MRRTAALVAIAAGCAALPALAGESFFYRGRPALIEVVAPTPVIPEVPAVPEAPSTLSFVPVSEAMAGTSLTSDAVALRGYRGLTLSVTSEHGELRACDDGSCSATDDAGWSRTAVIGAETHLQLRVSAPAAGSERVVTVSAANSSAEWRVASAAPAKPSGRIGDVYTIPEMEMDSDGHEMVARWLGTDREWTLCATERDFKAEFEQNCLGASSTLTFVRFLGNGYSAGAYVDGPPSAPNGGGRAAPGWYFASHAAFVGSKLTSTGAKTTAAMATVQYEPNGYGFIPLYTSSSDGLVATYDRNGEWRPNPRRHMDGQTGPAKIAYKWGEVLVRAFRR